MSDTIANLKQALSEMRKEQAVLAKGIAQIESTLESMSPAGKAPARRGRPPGSKNKPNPKPKAAIHAPAAAKKARAKPQWSAAQKSAAAERMRAYWAARKNEG